MDSQEEMARYLKIGDRVQINEQRPGFDTSQNGMDGTVIELCPDYPELNLHIQIDNTSHIYCSEDVSFRFLEGPPDSDLRNEEAKWQRYFE